MSATKRYGVRLTLPGAPAEPHHIPGLHVLVSPHELTTLEHDDDVERARYLQSQGAPIEVVDADSELAGDDLKKRAADLNIEGRSSMNADELRAAVALAENAQAGGEES
jgi:hypothetical protein